MKKIIPNIILLTTLTVSKAEQITVPTEIEAARRIEASLSKLHKALASQWENKTLSASDIEALWQKTIDNFIEHLGQKITEVSALSETLPTTIEMLPLEEQELWEDQIKAFGGEIAYELAKATDLYEKLTCKGPKSAGSICKNAIEEYLAILTARQQDAIAVHPRLLPLILNFPADSEQLVDQNGQTVLAVPQASPLEASSSQAPNSVLMHSGMMR